ncbi:MAG: hypothetical protein MH213_01190 [Marinobacter sp.]|nr:hypothetical protein [Marinobacter sp.]
MVFLKISRRPMAAAVLALMVWGVSFFLHFFWEMAQVPFFLGMAEARHWDVVWLCTRATLGDANIAFGAYTMAACVSRDWFWVAKSWSRSTLLVYLCVGLIVTIVFEYWATGDGQRWSYNEQMPELAVTGTGILPLAQWVVLPMLLAYSTRWMFLGWLVSKRIGVFHAKTDGAADDPRQSSRRNPGGGDNGTSRENVRDFQQIQSKTGFGTPGEHSDPRPTHREKGSIIIVQ